MFLVTFHIEIYYNTTSDTTAVLVCHVRRSITVSRHCLLLFVSYICYWHFHETAISKHFKILNIPLFRFSSIMNESIYGHYVIHKSTDKFEYRSLQVQFLLKVPFTQICSKFLRTKNCIFVSLLYMYDGCFNFSMLTTLHYFNFNLMTNKCAQHRKMLEQMNFFFASSQQFLIQAGLLIIQLSFW